MSHFTANFFIQNRHKLRNQTDPNTPIVITANGSMQRAADEPYKFIQDSNFWYLTGLNVPDLVLVITATETFLVIPELSAERQVFDGSHDLADLKARSGIIDIVDEKEGWQRIRSAIRVNHTVATLESLPPFLSRHRLHALPYRRRLVTKLKRLDSALVIQDIRAILALMRCVKQPEEIAAIQAAIDITINTLHDVTEPQVLQSARHEYELEAAIGYGFRHRGADGHAFEPIVGAGAHSTTLHHVDNFGPIGKSDMIVLDVGASVEHYAADITRTVSQQALSKRQRAVFDAVRTVQAEALALLTPGILPIEYEQQVNGLMAVQLQKLGLITGSDPAHIHQYFPHSTSHFLGLDTHDVGDYQKPFDVNMVVTCEPGIYIPEENIGIRLEDDVLITQTGNTVLSAACPLSLGFVQ